MRFLAVGILLTIHFVSATAASAAAVDQRLLVDRVWVWTETADAVGGTFEPDSTTAGHTFVFASDGSFKEDYPGGCCLYHGTWKIAGVRLVLNYTDEQREGQSLTYTVAALTGERLTLEARGRHGTVKQRFEKKPEEPEKEDVSQDDPADDESPKEE